MAHAAGPAAPVIDDLLISDVTGQKLRNVGSVPADCTVGELIQGVLADMKLPRNDGAGRPLVYHARLEREGKALHGAQSVGDALQSGDKLVLTPNIEAGSCRERR
jgi:hypothetical protein